MNRIYNNLIRSVLIFSLILVVNTFSDAQTNIHGRVKVSANNRFLQYEDGQPFFYLGETAWELFHRSSREDADTYLRNRAEKGYTVIQAVILAELDGLNTHNVYGDNPLLNNDPEKPNEAYFRHVDFILDLAASYGLVMGVLPSWGDKVVGSLPTFTEANAFVYGKFLGNRFKDKKNIIWILGGDRNWGGYEKIWSSMAKGIAIGTSGSEDYSKVTITLHPSGGSSSSQWFHKEPWLDFNMQQNGHCYITDAWNRISADYNRLPVKPVIDGEPIYEEHPICFDPAKNGTSTDYHCRRYLYHDLFAGALGHTYGCHAIWQFYSKEKPPINRPLRTWYESLNMPGAFQMQYGRYLIESRPFFSRIPDPSLISSSAGEGNQHISATRDTEGTYAFIYSESGNKFTVNLAKLKGKEIKAWWFDPRNGKAIYFDSFAKTASREFTPPSSGIGNDWVLVLDDASQKYPAPGTPIKKTDFKAPTTPKKLTISEISPVSAVIQWDASTDNNRVQGYHVFVNHQLVAATLNNKVTLTSLIPETSYSVEIKAIDASSNYSIKSDSIVFKTSADAEIKTIEIKGSEKNITIGNPLVLTTKIQPENVAYKKLSWVSENPAIATIDQNGVASPLKPGNTCLYAKSVSRTISNKWCITVLQPENCYESKYISRKITIDGIFSEKDWENLTSTTRVIDGQNDNTLSFKMLWDSTNLYIGASVTDSKIFSNSAIAWENDAIELYIDGNCNKGTSYDKYDRQFILPINQPVFEAQNRTDGVISKMIRTENGYNLEIAIPFKNIGIIPQLKSLLGFDISNIDSDNGSRQGVIMWKGTSSNWVDTRNFGTIVFEK